MPRLAWIESEIVSEPGPRANDDAAEISALRGSDVLAAHCLLSPRYSTPFTYSMYRIGQIPRLICFRPPSK
jgi:hypothetical protein